MINWGGISMDIGNVISDSLRYPTSNWSKVVILGVLFLFSFFIIPLFLALGYLFRVVKSSLAGAEELPVFEAWVEMMVDGFKLFLVYLIYTLPALIIGIFSFISLWSAIRSIIIYYLCKWDYIHSKYVVQCFRRYNFSWADYCRDYILVIYPIMVVAIGNRPIIMS
jgi:hypothetical protein